MKINTVTANRDPNNVLLSYQVTYIDTNRVKSVPIDEANRDYQEILEWVANGGTIVDNGA